MELNEPSAKYLVQAGFQQTEIGPIPLDWQVEPLAKVAEIRSGIAKNVNAEIADAIEVPYLRVANVQDGYLDLQEISTIRIHREDLRRYSVLPFDVLMNEGGDIDKLGRGALWRGQIQPCVHQNHVFVVRCKPALAPQFLSAWSASPPARRYFLFAGKQTTNLASINKTSLGRLPVAMPRLREEQERIAEALTDADALIESLEQLLAKKRQIKQGAMQELLTGQLRLPGFTKSWTRAQLSDICQMKSGESITSERIDEHAQYPCYGGNGIRGFTDRFTHSGPHVLVGRQGALCGNITFVDGKFFASEHAVVVTSTARSDICWLSYILTSMSLNQYSESSAQPGLAVARLLTLEVLAPDTLEQAAIATILSDMDTEITALEARLTKARQLKQGMAQALLTGRIRLV